jgi:GMP synthase (glutamine-hydrolysing)
MPGVSDPESVVGPRLLVLQHIACEPPGVYEDALIERGGSLVRMMVDRGEPLPDWHGFDGIVVMGGPMGAYEDERFPWLAREKQLIGSAAMVGVPVWGVCFGAQLLAASLRAEVAPGPTQEVGVLAVERTAQAPSDPVFSLLPETFHALQWHSDTFGLPEGAVLLARSDAYENQAFVFKRAYGLQFHIEVDSSLAREWGAVPDYAASLERIMGAGALRRLLERIETRSGEMEGLARLAFAAWLEQVVTPVGTVAA